MDIQHSDFNYEDPEIKAVDQVDNNANQLPDTCDQNSAIAVSAEADIGGGGHGTGEMEIDLMSLTNGFANQMSNNINEFQDRVKELDSRISSQSRNMQNTISSLEDLLSRERASLAAAKETIEEQENTIRELRDRIVALENSPFPGEIKENELAAFYCFCQDELVKLKRPFPQKEKLVLGQLALKFAKRWNGIASGTQSCYETLVAKNKNATKNAKHKNPRCRGARLPAHALQYFVQLCGKQHEGILKYANFFNNCQKKWQAMKGQGNVKKFEDMSRKDWERYRTEMDKYTAVHGKPKKYIKDRNAPKNPQTPFQFLCQEELAELQAVDQQVGEVTKELTTLCIKVSSQEAAKNEVFGEFKGHLQPEVFISLVSEDSDNETDEEEKGKDDEVTNKKKDEDKGHMAVEHLLGEEAKQEKSLDGTMAAIDKESCTFKGDLPELVVLSPTVLRECNSNETDEEKERDEKATNKDTDEGKSRCDVSSEGVDKQDADKISEGEEGHVRLADSLFCQEELSEVEALNSEHTAGEVAEELDRQHNEIAEQTKNRCEAAAAEHEAIFEEEPDANESEEAEGSSVFAQTFCDVPGEDQVSDQTDEGTVSIPLRPVS